MASQVIGGAVSQLQVLEIYSFFERLLCLHGNLDACCGRNTGVEDRTKTDICSGHLQDAEIEAMFLAPRMSAFLKIENKVFAEITGAKVYRGTGSGSPMCLPSLWT